MIFTSESPKVRFLKGVAVQILGALRSVTSIIPNVYLLKSENRELRRKNAELMAEVNMLKEAKLENIRLRKLLGFKLKHNEYKFIPADVVGKNLIGTHNHIIINVGREDGVSENMPVVGDAGIVGKVKEVGKSYSIAILAFHPDFRVSAKVQRSRVDGIIAWRGGSYLELLNVPKTLDVKKGDVVVTSEYSTIFPPGIEIGVVAEVDNSTPGLFKKILVKPFVDFTKLEEVFVIKYHPEVERIKLEKELEKR